MKKRIFILHGWAYATDKWEPFLLEFKRMGYGPVLLKIPGLTAPIEKAWTLDDYVSWLYKSVADEKEKVLLLGHSNGGRISLAFTAKYPEKVSQLILVDSAGIYHNELPIRIKRFVFGKAAKFGKVLTRSKRMKVLFYKFAHEHDYEKAGPFVKETMVNLIRSDVRSSLPRIIVPTTIIWGELDTVTPLSDGKVLHDGIISSTLHVVRGARHSPMFTHVDEVTTIVTKVL